MSELTMVPVKVTALLEQGEKGSGHAYTVLVLQKEHISEATDIFTQAFCDGEPLTQCLKIKYADFRPFALEVVTKASEDGLSIVAIDDTGKVIGCTIAEDFARPVIPSDHPKLAPIFSFLEELCKPFTQHQYKLNSVFHIWVTAVLEEYRGTKLSTLLNNSCVSRGIEKQFRYIYCEFTSVKNENIMKFYPENVKINSLPYNDYIYNGTKPFADLEGAASGYVCTTTPYFSLRNFSECIYA